MHILWTILIGLVVGLLARAVKPGRDTVGWVMTAVIGVGGALLATLVGQKLGWYGAGERAGFIASIGGAIVLLIAFEAVRKAAARRSQRAS